MLSVWPNLFNYQIIVPVILRLVLGGSLLALYLPAWRSARGLFGLLAGILILIGLVTQPASLAVALLLTEESWHGRHQRATLLPLLAIALSLLLLGPGLFAFDWPL
ncbi:MAG: hypothetical protein V1704_03820 [Candidatus Vogelbacteria bacterium]